jgi:urease accessory protein
MNGPLGLAGHRCMASIFFVTGSPLGRERRQGALDAAREVIDAHALSATAGATSPNDQVVIARVLASRVEPAMDLMKRVRAAWRGHFWQLPAANPRIWAM